MVRRLKRPLLNISPERWQVRLGEPGHGLPFLWTAKPVLSDPGDAIALAITGSDLQYYLPATATGTSIYRPLVTSLPTAGRASIRIRQVLPEAGNITVVEGTFTSPERIEMASHDLAWFRLNLARGDINLYAHLEADSAMAPGEWRYRTVAQSLNDTEVLDLRAAEGVPMTEVPFEIIPLLSSPCDLYSLAVLALRILLIDDSNSLPVVLDETLSLARQIEAEGNASADIEAQTTNIFTTDRRWGESLGPHHLTLDETTAEEALAVIPLELWCPTLVAILRMFPGQLRGGQCADYGDARPGGLHKVFERTLSDLDGLILKSRSLIVADWKSNAEICAVIQQLLA
jgi:hypothetical protein